MDTSAAWRTYRRTHDENLRNAIVESHLPLVHHVADHMRLRLPRVVSIDDLRGSGMLGLMRAVELYDPARGSFVGYAWTRIRGAMLDELRALDWVPRTAKRQLPGWVQRRGGSPRRTDRGTAKMVSMPETIAVADGRQDPGDAAADRDEVAAALHGIPRIEREILEQYYGLGRTQLEIARSLGISEGRVSQIRREVLLRRGRMQP